VGFCPLAPDGRTPIARPFDDPEQSGNPLLPSFRYFHQWCSSYTKPPSVYAKLLRNSTTVCACFGKLPGNGNEL